MRIIKSIGEMKEAIRASKAAGRTVGLVPTMGDLHEGHLSLVRASVKDMDETVVSIFVNPAQFGPKEDFEEYPRSLKRDAEILEKEGVSFVFAPEDDEIYPDNYKTYVEVHDLQEKLCGSSRPGHFRGVSTVVLKLFHIVDPDTVFFGQKDAQQGIILKKMVQDLNMDVKIELLPIVRDRNGLALSSRNAYLSKEEREASLILFRSLNEAERMIKNGERDASRIIEHIQAVIRTEPLVKLDYAEIVDCVELKPVLRIGNEILIAVAAYVGKARLIDNILLCVKE